MRTFIKLAFSARRRVKDISFDTTMEFGNSSFSLDREMGNNYLLCPLQSVIF